VFRRGGEQGKRKFSSGGIHPSPTNLRREKGLKGKRRYHYLSLREYLCKVGGRDL